jgi:hypothetical protein
VLRPWRAAERLGLTTRQIRRLVSRLRDQGAPGLVSRRRSKPSNNRLDAVTAYFGEAEQDFRLKPNKVFAG